MPKDKIFIEKEFNKKGNMIAATLATGIRAKYKYDRHGNRVYAIFSDDLEVKHKYDENNNLIETSTSYDGFQSYKTYKNSQLVYEKKKNGNEYIFKYNRFGERQVIKLTPKDK